MEPELAKRLVLSLKDSGINFLSYLPETRLTQILPLMRQDPFFQLAPCASEAEAVTIAAGAVLGGKQAACYCENTGLYVSCYHLLAVGKQLGVPILLVVGFLGGFADERNSFHYATMGNRTIPILEGMGFEYKLIDDGANLEVHVRNAVRTMNSRRAPVALLFAGEFSV